MRTLTLAVLTLSLSAAAQTPAPTSPAKPKAPVIKAPTRTPLHHAVAARTVLYAPVASPAHRASLTTPVLSAPIRPTHHAAHRAPVRPAVHTAHATRPTAPRSAPSVADLTPVPFSQNPINQLRGNARALLVFAPDSANPALQRQFALLNNHVGNLSQRDTVFVPIVTVHHGSDDVFSGENIPSGTYRDQLSARRNFGVKYNDFTVILLDETGREAFRSHTPISITELDAQLDHQPRLTQHAELTQPR